MKRNIEIEFKSLIDEKTYQDLINKYNLENEVIKQTNFYFDTINFDLLKSHQVLRIREKNNSYKLTLKVGNHTYNDEFNYLITKSHFDLLLENGFDTNNYFKQINFFVTFKKKLITYRAKYKYLDGYLFFDKSIYNGITDYEVEYEASNFEEGLKDFNHFLKEHNIEYVKTRKKSERALR